MIDPFEDRLFTCPLCGQIEYFAYHKDLKEPDRIVCKKCKEVYWWSPTQKKLYNEISKEEIHEDFMKLFDIPY